LPFYQSWAKQFHVYVPTHPGFGKSAGFENIDSIEDMAFHYVELFDALGFEQVILGGCSLGGWIAAEFTVALAPARQASLADRRARSLGRSDAPARPISSDAGSRQDAGAALSRPAVIRRQAGHSGQSRRRADADGLSVDDRACPPDLGPAVRPKLAARLRRVQCPTLLLWGKEDRLVPPAYAETYKKHIPHAELQWIEECGHLPMFEREAEFVDGGDEVLPGVICSPLPIA